MLRTQLRAPSTRCSSNKYYFDEFNGSCFAGGARMLGSGCGRAATTR